MNAIIKLNRIQYNLEHYALYTAYFSLFVLAGCYMYLLSISVVHVVMSEEIADDTYKVNSEIATLEAKYMEEQHRISDKIVAQSNFIQNVDKIFINKEHNVALRR